MTAMDPNVALREIRLLIRQHRLIGLNDNGFGQLVDRFEALDGWLSKGGFLPDEWDDKG